MAALARAEGAPVGADRVGRALRARVRLERRRGDAEALARALAALSELEALPAPERAAARCELGLVLERALGRPDEAAAAFERALALDPQSVPAARALAALLRAPGRERELAAVYALEARAQVDPSRRVWLETQTGDLRHALGEAAAAVEAYERALALDPGALLALRGLAGVARATGDFHRLARALEALAERSPSPVDRLEARRELARVCEEALGDARRAVECYRRVVAEAPEDVESVRGLARGLRELGDAPGLAQALEHELRLVHELDRRRLLALEAARLREDLAEQTRDVAAGRAQLEAALGHARLAAELAPDDADALGGLARVAERLGRWPELAEVTRRLAGVVDDKARSGWLLRRAAKLHALRLQDPRGAVAAYLEATAVDPSDREAWQALEPLAHELGDDELLERTLEQLVGLARNDGERAQTALRLGRQRVKLGRLAEALEAFSLARELGKGPVRGQALEALEGALRLAGRPAELAAVLEQRAQGLRAPEARDLLLERAAILEDQLGRPDLAIDVLGKLERLVPDDARVASELERLLASQRRWEELAGLYERQAERRGPRGYDALVLLGRVLRDQLDQAERAAAALQRAVAINPAGVEALEALRDLYVKTERWPELFRTLELELGLTKGTRQRESRLRRAGHLAEDKLGDLVSAARLYAEARALAPRDRHLVADLARVQEARGDWVGLLETLERDAGLCEDAGERAGLRKRMAQVHAERLFHAQDALVQVRAALELAPKDEEALALLTELLRGLAAWDELAQVLERRLARARGPEGVGLKLELAQVRAERLGRPEQALQAAEQALEDDPRCLEAVLLQVRVFRRLEAAAGKAGAPAHEAGHARALSRLADLREGAERADALVELSDLLRRRPGSEGPALEALERAVAAAPAHRGAVERLTEVLRATGAWDRLLRTLEQAAAAATTTYDRCDHLTKAAEVLEQRLLDLDRAEARYREALAETASHLPALHGLARTLQARGCGLPGAAPARAEELARLEEQAGELEADPRAKAQAWARAGDVRREALEQYPQARALYDKAVRACPTAFEPLASLAELALAANDRRAALGALERVAASPDLVADPDRGADLMWSRATLLQHAGRLEAAAGSLRRALELRPDHLGALEDLGRLSLAGEAWPAVRGVYEDLVARTRAPQVRACHQVPLARALARLGEPERAVEALRAALGVVPADSEANLLLASLLAAKAPKEARRHYERALAQGARKEQVEARLALADLCEGPLEDPAAAIGHLAAATALEGAHRGKAHRRLAEALGRTERWAAALHHLARAVLHERDLRQRAALYSNMARVLRDRLRQRPLARRCFERAFALDPDDRHTFESLLRLLEADGDVAAQARVLGVSADRAAASGRGDEAALRVRRAGILAASGHLPEAIADWERVLALDPRQQGARAALAELYGRTGDAAGIERVRREQLALDPLQLEAYRALCDAWGKAGRKDEQGQAAQVLSVLRAATAEEERLVRAATAQVPQHKGALDEDAFAGELVPAFARGPLLDLLRAAGPLLLKQVPDDLKQHGIGWRSTRLGLEGNAFPEHKLLRRVASLLGLDALDVYWMPDWKQPEPVVGHAKGSPALILCPEPFAGLGEPEKAFVLARALAPLRCGLELVRAVPGDALRLWLLAAAKACDAARAFPGDDDRTLRGIVKAVSRAPEVVRAAAPAAARVWAARDALDLDGLRRGLSFAATRAGALAAGGPAPAVRALVASNLALRGRLPEKTEAVLAALANLPEVGDVLAFSVSAEGTRLRQRALRGKA